MNRWVGLPVGVQVALRLVPRPVLWGQGARSIADDAPPLPHNHTPYQGPTGGRGMAYKLTQEEIKIVEDAKVMIMGRI